MNLIELQRALRQLRLGGMADVLAIRWMQSRVVRGTSTEIRP